MLPAGSCRRAGLEDPVAWLLRDRADHNRAGAEDGVLGRDDPHLAEELRPAAGAAFAVISPLTGVEAPGARSTAVAGTVSEPSAEEKNTSR